MSTALTPTTPTLDPTTIERVLLHGDLRQLTPTQKVSYYQRVCDSLGLNPLTQPFAYMVLSGKEVLYAKRDAAEQLRKIHNISIEIKSRELIDTCYVVTASATMPNGRKDESTGVVAIEQLKGEARANALMKCETKAKRRVTLSICGLGMLDETEVATIPGATTVDPATGEVIEPVTNGNGAPKPDGYDARITELEQIAKAEGFAGLNRAWKATPLRLTQAMPIAERDRLKGLAQATDARNAQAPA